MPHDPGRDAAYLAYQYSDADKLNVRYDAHARYSVDKSNFFEWVIDQLSPRHGAYLLDVGCGPGAYHPILAARGVSVVAVDSSAGMIAEAREQARSLELDVRASVASAERLPFASASFDYVMANHMLYHVPDRERALREMQRVLTPGGRIVLATNAADNNVRLFELHERAARDCGFTPMRVTASRFTLDDIELVHSVFPTATATVRENAFAFPDADAALAYYASFQVDEVEERADDGAHRLPLLRRMRELVVAILDREGVLLVPKNAGCFVADV